MHDENSNECLVCKGALETGRGRFRNRGDREGYWCCNCGRYEISHSAKIDWFVSTRSSLTALHRAVLSHNIRTMNENGGTAIINSASMDHLIKHARLPSLNEQAMNFVRAVGDYFSETGEAKEISPPSCTPLVGSFGVGMFLKLLADLERKGVVDRVDAGRNVQLMSGAVDRPRTYELTLAGWEMYDSERKGQFAGRYGFIAMKFGDEKLDAFVQDTVKPVVRTAIDYELVDLRDVPEAGIIDNIMRQRIRDAAFVLVDLTHDNSGAYWEAGYAEGLGKPVIYLCEQSKFDAHKTHFDTNHCTTVPWSVDDVDRFSKNLVATLRRTLSLFSDPTID